jgi:cytochrome c peroxidase
LPKTGKRWSESNVSLWRRITKLMKTFFFRSLICPALLVALSLPLRAALPPHAAPGDLRNRAKETLEIIPNSMPGAEKDTARQISLGRTLFFDVRLSANNSQSCNSCHAVDRGRGGVDNEPTSPGAFGKRGGRNSPTVLNAGFHATQFWDGRAQDLVAQAKGPILNPIEMAMPSEEAVVKKLSAIPEYEPLFAQAFPDEKKPLTYENIARAIAAFERTLVTRDRFDDFLKGADRALNAQEMNGLDLFVTIGCTACHNGPLLGGNSYQKLGLIHSYKTDDLGRFVVTKEDDDKFKFKVPSLRNIDLTGPYLHDGSKGTLDEIVRDMAWLQLDRKLTEPEVKAISAFLKTLTDKERAAAAAKPRAAL